MKKLSENKYSGLIILRRQGIMNLYRLVNKRILLLLICPLFVLSVSCTSKASRTNQIIDNRFGDTEIMNYEYTNRGLSSEAADIHYLVNTEIDDPSVVSVKFPDIGGVHAAAPAEGYAIVQFTSDANGKMVKYRFVKRAGLGLDNYVEKMVQGIEIIPLVHKGEKRSSVFNVRFIFREMP